MPALLASLRPRCLQPATPTQAARGRPRRDGPGGQNPGRRGAAVTPNLSPPPHVSFFSFVFFSSAGAGIPGEPKCSLKMADGYEDLREDELPGPAYEGYESAELACPAERSGHVAVSDGRHMFVWGGYKVSGRPGRAGVGRQLPVGGGGRARVATPGAFSAPAPRLRRLVHSLASVGIFPRVSPPVPGLLGCCHARLLLTKPAPRSLPALAHVRALPAEGAAGGGRPRNFSLFSP